jgi:hypothetical protein
MENTYFDYGQEFSRIQHMFAKVINTEVLAETGVFYWGSDTTGYDVSHDLTRPFPPSRSKLL